MTVAKIVADLYEVVWSRGDLVAVDDLVGPAYTIHHDPGDAWEGRILGRDEYRRRVLYSRTAFPDLAFTVHDLVADGNRVVARWSARGTQTGALDQIPATGKQLSFTGMTLYELVSGRVSGHWQTIDRLGFLQQLGAARPGATRIVGSG